MFKLSGLTVLLLLWFGSVWGTEALNCTSSWLKYPDVSLHGGVRLTDADDTETCQRECVSDTSCVAVTLSGGECWLHFDDVALVDIHSPGATLYRLLDRCVTRPTYVDRTNFTTFWRVHQSTSSPGGVRWSLSVDIETCQRACVTNTSCVAVDVRGTECLLHLNDSNLSIKNTTRNSTQYVLVDRVMTTGCLYNISGMAGNITSPNYPDKYPNNAYCRYIITVPPGYRIRLSFDTFSLERERLCRLDAVAVNIGFGRIRRLCGMTVISNLTSLSNTMSMTFQSDPSVTYSGFMASYTAFKSNTTVPTSRGTTWPPFFTNTPRAVQTRTFTTTTPPSTTTSTTTTTTTTSTTTEVEMEQSPAVPIKGTKCTTTWTVAMGYTAPGKRYIGRYIVDDCKRLCVSNSSCAAIEMRGSSCSFYLNATSLVRGFNYYSANTYILHDRCGIRDSTLHLTSCTTEWTLQDSVLPSFDAVIISSGNITECQMKCVDDRHCAAVSGMWACMLSTNISRGGPGNNTTGNSTVHILEDRCSSLTTIEIQESVNQDCGGQLTSPSGSLTSPGYPSLYPTNTVCTWDITVPRGLVVQVVFLTFDVGNTFYCRHGYVGIDEHRNSSLNRFCGDTNPGIVQSDDNTLQIIFKSTNLRGKGFSARYISINANDIGCGGNLTGTFGILTSPNFPKPYPHNADCTWYITVPLGLIIDLTFISFRMEEGTWCRHDSVTVYDNGDSTESLGRFCGRANPGTLRSRDHTMVVVLKSDGSDALDGFSATYTARNTTTINNCGGNLSEPFGVITSPSTVSGYPDNMEYPHNSDCLWIISAPAGFVVGLTFTMFYLSGDCDADYVALYDDINQDSPLGRLCRRGNPGMFVSATNTLVILFKSDSKYTAPGFVANYTTMNASSIVCGGSLSNISGSFSSPLYPEIAPNNAKCRWQIIVPEGFVVKLAFSSFRMAYSYTCSESYLGVYDGLNQNKSLGRFCGNNKPERLLSSGNSMLVVFKTDVSFSLNRFMVEYLAINATNVGCGGNFTAPSGNFSSPFYPETYPNNVDCSYYITAPQGMVIKLTFNNIELANSWYSCYGDRIRVYDFDAQRNQSSLIDTFCRPMTYPLISKAHNLLVVFTSDSRASRIGFSASYEFTNSSELGCGGNLTGHQGNFTSPRYPNKYPTNIKCTWKILVPEGLVVHLVFNSFQLQSGYSCPNDKVQIYDNFNLTTSLGSFCGGSTPPQVVSGDNSMLVEFKSGNVTPRRGFTASYIAVNNSVPGCGGILTGQQGNFTSPSHPNNYPININCDWKITVPEGQIIRLLFRSFQLQSGFRCNRDKVEIYDQFNRNASLGRFCGSSTPRLIVSTNNTMLVEFISDSEYTRRGFFASYSAVDSGSPVCGGNFTNATGRISSPNHPYTYPHQTLCKWYINIPPGLIINLVFTNFQLESGGRRCNLDSVTLYDDFNQTRQIGRYCGRTNPGSIQSTSNTMLVVFESDSSVAFDGFSAIYSGWNASVVTAPPTIMTSPPPECGGNFTQINGTISTPNHPYNYPQDTMCKWYINIPPRLIINLVFTNFQLESGGRRCSLDSVTLYDDLNQTTLLGRYCGRTNPGSIQSTSNTMLVVFESDSSLAYDGFSAMYYGLDASSVSSFTTMPTSVTPGSACGGNFTQISGMFATPNYPRSYPHDALCLWYINVQPGRVIRLTFQDFRIESSALPSCRLDSVTVYEDLEQTIRLGRYCGRTNPGSIQSTSNTMLVVLKTDGSVSYVGFSAIYQSAPLVTVSTTRPTSTPSSPYTTTTVNTNGTGCGGQLTALRGTIQTPSHPNNYPHYADCHWNINVPVGYVITLRFTTFHLEAHSSCIYDYLGVYDSINQTNLLGRFCGPTHPSPLTSAYNTMFIVFKSDGSEAYSGFSATYTTTFTNHSGPPTPGPTPPTTSWPSTLSTARPPSCGGYLWGDSGNISTPNYPRRYPPHYECRWYISVNQGMIVKIHFFDFRLERGYNCSNDYVALYEHLNQTELLGRYCGQVSPGKMMSSGNTLLLVFKSDGSVALDGFFATYTALDASEYGCGGNRTALSGTITSPDYADVYPHNSDCRWYITAPPGYRIRLVFSRIQLEADPHCDKDSVSVRDPTILGRFCGNDRPGALLSLHNTMAVVFTSDSSSAEKGFSATYTAFPSDGRGSLPTNPNDSSTESSTETTPTTTTATTTSTKSTPTTTTKSTTTKTTPTTTTKSSPTTTYTTSTTTTTTTTTTPTPTTTTTTIPSTTTPTTTTTTHKTTPHPTTKAALVGEKTYNAQSSGHMSHTHIIIIIVACTLIVLAVIVGVVVILSIRARRPRSTPEHAQAASAPQVIPLPELPRYVDLAAMATDQNRDSMVQASDELEKVDLGKTS